MYKPWDRLMSPMICYQSDSGSNVYSYPPYLEGIHKHLLYRPGYEGHDWAVSSIFQCMNDAFNQSPYGTWTAVDIKSAFLGTSVISDYPSLYALLDTFMIGLDIDALWTETYNNTANGTAVQDSVSAQAAMMDDDIEINIMPRMLAGMRDINSVMSSTFVVARGIVETARTKAISKYSADLRFKLFEITENRWTKHLDWNKSVVDMYGQYAKLYISAQMDMDTQEMDFKTKDELWNLKLFESARAMLGALQGTATQGGLNEPTQAAKSISGAMSGAAMGAQISGGSGYGAAIGGIAGLAASFI